MTNGPANTGASDHLRRRVRCFTRDGQAIAIVAHLIKLAERLG
jgi:hypothetical protein